MHSVNIDVRTELDRVLVILGQAVASAVSAEEHLLSVLAGEASEDIAKTVTSIGYGIKHLAAASAYLGICYGIMISYPSRGVEMMKIKFRHYFRFLNLLNHGQLSMVRKGDDPLPAL